ncbi:hypothetical protein FQZ97_1092780 [compost metagenome]
MTHAADDGEDLIDDEIVGEAVADFAFGEVKRRDRFCFRDVARKQAAIAFGEIKTLVVAVVADRGVAGADVEQAVLLVRFKRDAVVVVKPDQRLDRAIEIALEPGDADVDERLAIPGGQRAQPFFEP